MLATLASSQAISQTGCLAYQGNQYCSLCDASNLYYQIGNGCVRYSGNACTSIDYAGNCINCQQGFYLAYGNTCTLVTYIVGCTLYGTDTSTTICRSCASGYILVGNRCLQSVPNCVQYIKGTNICAQCSLGYTQAPDWCSCVVGNITACVQYDCIGLCVLCNANLPRLSPSRSQCFTYTPYCAVELPTQNGCRRCYPGYVLSSDSLACFPGIPFCATYVPTPSGSQLLCQSCLTNYYLSGNQLTCNGIIPNCAQIDIVNLICITCSPGYVLTDDKLACLPAIPNCLIYQPTSKLSPFQKCLKCLPSYMPDLSWTNCVLQCANGYTSCNVTGQCIVIPQCCEFYDNCGNCLTVKAGFLWCERKYCVAIPTECPNNYDLCGVCVCPTGQSWCSAKKTCVAVPSCCVNHDGCGNCITTTPGTTFCLLDLKCYNIPTNCLQWDNCGSCTCSNGNTLCPATKVCVQEPICCPGQSDLCGNCLKTIAGYNWCAATKTCSPVNPLCPSNDNGCGVCTCATGNWCQAKGQCVTNPGCPAGATYDGCGSCTCPNGQLYCAASNTCTTILSCWATWNNCGVLTLKPNTLVCPGTGLCVNILPACPNSFDCVNNKCICTGSQTYCPATQNCATVPSCCATNDNCGNCLTVIPGTTWFNGQCFTNVVIPNCITYTQNNQLCTQCAATYQLANNGLSCLPPIQLCTTYVPWTSTSLFVTCSICLWPYFPSVDKKSCIIPNCQIENRQPNSLTCTQCSLGFTNISPDSKICTPPIQFCLSYDWSGALPFGNNCLTCSLPFKVQSGICVAAKFIIAQHGFGSLINSGANFFAVNLVGGVPTLLWGAYSTANAASWSYVWEFSPITSLINTYSIRVFVSFIVLGNSVATLNPISLSSSVGSNLVTAQQYIEVGGVAIQDQKWIVTVDSSTPGTVNVRSASTNLFIDTGLTLLPTPTPLLLIPQ